MQLSTPVESLSDSCAEPKKHAADAYFTLAAAIRVSIQICQCAEHDVISARNPKFDVKPML
jgi:hypothetical protein